MLSVVKHEFNESNVKSELQSDAGSVGGKQRAQIIKLSLSVETEHFLVTYLTESGVSSLMGL